jgi:stage II sporulation protein D (peptidoglycan lytic transglycosylase)
MKTTTTFLALILASSLTVAQNVRIGVLGLFHPRELALSVPAGSALVIHVGGESVALEGSSGVNIAHIRLRGDNVVLEVGTRVLPASELSVTSRESGPVDFNLAVPGKIKRHYRGILELKPSSRALTAVVIMDLETAVASVVAAESEPGTPSEALKALAVAARSYFVAGKGRHRDFDFCDTTHCQFLREPLASNTAAAQAISATRGLVIAYQSQPLAAMYTRSCSGSTRTPAELGLPPVAYPYYSVDCKYCRQHPSRWESRLSTADAVTLHNSNESSRLRLGRSLGWAAVPSNNFVILKEGEQTILRGVGQGHGIGLCQAGARAMAEEGADFREILAHYYPNTVIIALGRAAALR